MNRVARKRCGAHLGPGEVAGGALHAEAAQAVDDLGARVGVGAVREPGVGRQVELRHRRAGVDELGRLTQPGAVRRHRDAVELPDDVVERRVVARQSGDQQPVAVLHRHHVDVRQEQLREKLHLQPRAALKKDKGSPYSITERMVPRS